MKKALYGLLLVLLTAPLLSAGHYRFGRFYGPGSFHSYRSHSARYLHRLIPYGYGFRAGHGYYGGFLRRAPYRYSPSYRPYRPYGYAPGYSDYRGAYRYAAPASPSGYYGAGGSYAVYLGPSNAAPVVRANYSEVLFNVTPGRALVYVDGNLIGSASSFAKERDRYPIMEGEHQLKIDLPGYQPFEATLQVVADRDLRIDVQLER